MTKLFKPMLAGDAILEQLRFPLLASVKLDGVRAIVRNGVVYSRSNKPIPNPFIQRRFKNCEYYDGELILGEPTNKNCYRQTVSTVMSQVDLGDYVHFYVFDHIQNQFAPYTSRMSLIKPGPMVFPLPQRTIRDLSELIDYEQDQLSRGHEGLILRSAEAPYKMGRSSTREGYLLKLKRFKDAEFEVIGFEERMHNANEAITNELGYTSRSSHQENMQGRGDLGAIVCKYGDTTFNVGTGFNDNERAVIWAARDRYIGKLVKVKYFAIGMKDVPRHPVFLGFREEL